jgi:hypothetical protein
MRKESIQRKDSTSLPIFPLNMLLPITIYSSAANILIVLIHPPSSPR